MNRNANKELTECKAKLGEEFGAAYYHARAEWIDLRLTWKQFESLFCSGPERINLLSRCGRGFFFLVEKTFFEATLLAICRLTDPERTGKKSNLTVNGFKKFMKSDKQKRDMEDLLAKVESNISFARNWRNWRIGHNDYDLIVGRARLLEQASIDDINASIADLGRIFKYINNEFLGIELLDTIGFTKGNNEMTTINILTLGYEKFRLNNLDDENYE